ncbi:hypothetical protein B0H11DRAFT_2214950 [Mycena galericulata]|nr:hypothetical protein B0H11DRAFT_2214950 [Mycena galericulata]
MSEIAAVESGTPAGTENKYIIMLELAEDASLESHIERLTAYAKSTAQESGGVAFRVEELFGRDEYLATLPPNVVRWLGTQPEVEVLFSAGATLTLFT